MPGTYAYAGCSSGKWLATDVSTCTLSKISRRSLFIAKIPSSLSRDASLATDWFSTSHGSCTLIIKLIRACSNSSSVEWSLLLTKKWCPHEQTLNVLHSDAFWTCFPSVFSNRSSQLPPQCIFPGTVVVIRFAIILRLKNVLEPSHSPHSTFSAHPTSLTSSTKWPRVCYLEVSIPDSW